MSTRFSIMAAVRNGYILVGTEWRYLARLAILPAGVLLITYLVAYFNGVAISPFTAFVLNLPANVLQGWFAFMEVRLILLNERAPFVAQSQQQLQERHRCLKLCVLTWLLYMAWTTAIFGYRTWADQQSTQSTFLTVMGLVLLVLSFWSIRFAVTPILAAVDFPIRRYVFAVNGLTISFRLLGLLIVCASPVLLLGGGLLSIIFPPREVWSQTDAILLIMVVCVLATILMPLVIASSCYAMKEMLGRMDREKKA